MESAAESLVQKEETFGQQTISRPANNGTRESIITESGCFSDPFKSIGHPLRLKVRRRRRMTPSQLASTGYANDQRGPRTPRLVLPPSAGTRRLKILLTSCCTCSIFTRTHIPSRLPLRYTKQLHTIGCHNTFERNINTKCI